jgi:hypothetical protein
MIPEIKTRGALFGLMAEFATPEALLAAARRGRADGYVAMEAYSPFPVEGMRDAVGFERTRLPVVVLIGGLIGGAAGFWMQYWVSVIDYPLNIGGKPDNSWPAFIPITFEMTILGAALSAVLGMLALNGLPRPHHPVFAVDAFARASRDRFFLLVSAADPRFDAAATRGFLAALGPVAVEEVRA